MDEAASKLAVEAAKRGGVQTAEWLTEAINEKLFREREPVEGEIEAPRQDAPTVGTERPDVPLEALVRMICALSSKDVRNTKPVLLARAQLTAMLNAGSTALSRLSPPRRSAPGRSADRSAESVPAPDGP